MHRHDLVWVDPRADWTPLTPGAGARLQAWLQAGHPLVVARRDPGTDGTQQRLGVPLPLAEGRQRLSLRCAPDGIVKHAPPPSLAAVIQALPAALRPPLLALQASTSELAPARVFGSYAWQALTGATYLRPDSDLDLLWEVQDVVQADVVCARLRHWEAAGTLRADGELRFPGQRAVQWREYAGEARMLLVKGDADCWLSPRSALPAPRCTA